MTKADAIKAILAAILVAPHIELPGNTSESALAMDHRLRSNKKRIEDAQNLVKELL